MRKVLGVVGIGIGMMILGMLWSTTNMALSAIQQDLSASLLELQWGMNAYGIFMCITLIIVGKCADAYGRKFFFLIGLLLALLCSLVGGFAPNIHVWITSMCVLGLAGSIILPLSQALLVHQFPESRKSFAISLWSIFSSISLAIGPLVGGTLVRFWGWRWIYLINILPMLLATLMVFFFVEKEKEFHKAECDWSGVGLLAVFVASIVIAVLQGPTWGWTSLTILGLFSLAILILILFIIIEKRSSKPLFRRDLFLQRSFLSSAIPNGCMIGILWVVFFLLPLYLQNIRGYSSFQTGVFFLLITLPLTFFSHSVNVCYSKIGARPLLLVGFSLFTLAALIQVLFASESLIPVSITCLAIGFGWAIAWGPSIATALTAIPHRLAGLASGMFLTLQEIGGVVTLAVGGMIFREVIYKESSFQLGYRAAFWFLAGVSVFALLVSLLIPKKKHQ